MTDTTSKHITGYAALALADMLGMPLRKHADPIEGALDNVTIALGRDIARQDASLLWLHGDDVAEALDDENIMLLRQQAAEAGDMDQVALCDRALYGTADEPGTILALVAPGHLTTSQVEARVECARVLAEARSQS